MQLHDDTTVRPTATAVKPNTRFVIVKVVAIGTSHGGLHPLQSIVRHLPRTFAPPVLVVQHVGPADSMLPSILNDLEVLPAAHARHGEVVEAQRIYVAPPGLHMLVVNDRIVLSRGPRENWARPAIDPLFRSVAEAYGPDAVGIVLSGQLNDGTVGLYEIKRRGGIAIVQDPKEAEAQSMPASALEHVAIDYCVCAVDISALLVRLTEEGRNPDATNHSVDSPSAIPTRVERPVALTCPDCGGAMREEDLGNLTRYRCHIGHAMTAEVMAMAGLENVQNRFAALLRALKERAELCEDMAQKYASAGGRAAAAAWSQAAEQVIARETTIRDLLESDWLHPENELRKRAG